MSKDKTPKEFIVGRNIRLTCQICGHKRFYTRKTLMNTVAFSFLNIDWANKKATNYICAQCGYIHWFMEE